LCRKDGADGDREKRDGQDRLMQMVVLISANDRGEHKGFKLAGNRRSDDMPAKIGVEVAAWRSAQMHFCEARRCMKPGFCTSG
jgi:hypothetical protein